ncbi:hypothetical protein GYB29_13180 [bacterium]|nr:hypothetical protein [bacterium]
MKIPSPFITLTLLLIFLNACSALTGEEVARLPVNKLTIDDSNYRMEKTTLDLKAGDELAIWSDMDIEYTGEVALRFRLEILKDGEKFGGIEIDPTDKDVTLGETKVAINDKTSWSFSGRNSVLTIEEDGEYLFKAILISAGNPSLKIEKAELVLKM